MLKLHKSSDGEQIHIALREKERFFSSLLLKALALALGFHYACFLLFTIQQFKFTSSFQFPSSTVQTDFISTSVDSSQPEIPTISLPAPPFTVMYPRTVNRFKQESIPSSAFLNLESRRQSISSIQWVERPKITIIVSGEIANLTFELEYSYLNEKVLVPIEKDPQSIQYNVIVHETTGEVFWYERLKDTTAAYLDPIVETILLNLKFKTDGSLNAKKGQIDFLIYRQEGNKI